MARRPRPDDPRPKEGSLKLRAWLGERRDEYRYDSILRDELDIPKSQWDHIIGGRGYSRDINNTAKIFIRTGIAEFDPRTLPPKKQYNRNLKKVTPHPVAWTSAQYERVWSRWRGKKDPATTPNVVESPDPVSSPEAVTAVHTGPVATPRAPTLGGTFGELLGLRIAQQVDGFVGLFAQEVARLVITQMPAQSKNSLDTGEITQVSGLLDRMEQLTAVLSASFQAQGRRIGVRTNQESEDIGALSRKLLKALQTNIRLAADDPRQLQLLGDKHGQSLANLLKWADILTLEGEARERALQLLKSTEQF